MIIMDGTFLFVGGIGPMELAFILMIVVLLFGANKLPELARSSGQAMGEFRKGRQEIERELKETASVEATASRAAEREDAELIESESGATN
ncbi:MAG: sec-independent protein translocase protein TatA [Halobacteriales archaeon]|jgi:sec-independent protein translocase protein TatA